MQERGVRVFHSPLGCAQFFFRKVRAKAKTAVPIKAATAAALYHFALCDAADAGARCDLVSVKLATFRSSDSSGGIVTFNPNSAVAIDGKREVQSLRNEVDGFLLLSKHRSAVLRRLVEFRSNDLTIDKMTLRLQSRTPSLLQDCTSLPAFPV